MHDVGDHVDGEELRGVYSSPGTISAIKSRNVRRVRHVETLRKGSCLQNIGPETRGEYIKSFPFFAFLYIKHFFNIPKNVHFYLIHMSFSSHVSYMFRCVI